MTAISDKVSSDFSFEVGAEEESFEVEIGEISNDLSFDISMPEESFTIEVGDSGETVTFQIGGEVESLKLLADHLKDFKNPHKVVSSQVLDVLYGDVETGLKSITAAISDMQMSGGFGIEAITNTELMDMAISCGLKGN